LADMVLNFARNGETEPLGEYFAAGYTADFANARGDTPLILAAYHGHADAVRLILDQPDRAVDRLNQMGFTALAGASFKGDVAIVRLLIQAGADVNATGPGGKTPLMFAALTNREAAVELLLESGADPLAKATDGSTAASLAAGQGSAALAERLSEGRR
ncbi:MAG: ankyrin repeat domain-containing protein, partial [Chloroflexota bacterium]|nr:ankyrin repeat domain-containing protein [Chloroflexota bacterium]